MSEGEPGDSGSMQEPVYVEERSGEVEATPEAVWSAVRHTAGRGTGLTALMWSVRGLADRAADQVLPGRSEPTWVEEEVDAPRRLHLRAGARLPGRATLTLEVTPGETPGTWRVTQTNTFEPDGVLGRAYWHALLPAHRVVFARMFADLLAAARRQG